MEFDYIFLIFFLQLNNWYAVKQQYNPLNTLYFYLSQTHFSHLSKNKYGATLTKVYWSG